MSQEEKEVRIEGVVRASGYIPDAPGKQFLGAIIEGGDGKAWVIDYDEQSPFHAFAGRLVTVDGESYEPTGQKLIAGRGQVGIGHLRVTTLLLVTATPDAPLVEVGASQKLTGRFEPRTTDTEEASLSFITERGDILSVFNDPAGATSGRTVEVLAYPVQAARSTADRSEQYWWIICPCSAADLGTGASGGDLKPATAGDN